MSGGSGGTTTVQKSYTPMEEQIRNTLLQQGLNTYYSTMGQGGAYPGAAPIPASQQTQQARQMLTQAALGPGQDVSMAAGNALKFGLSDVLKPESNPSLQSYLDSATRRISDTYTDPNGVLAQIRNNFTAGNSGGTSTREGIAGGLAAKSFLNTIGDVTANVTNTAYGQGLDTFGKAMAFAPQTYGLITQPAQTLATVGGSIESDKAAQEAYAAAQRQWTLNQPWMGLQNLGSLFSGVAAPGSTTSMDPAKNPAMSAAGGAMAGWALGAQMGAGYGPYGAAIGALAGLVLS